MLNWSNSTGIIFQKCDLCKRYEEVSVTSLLCSAGILGHHLSTSTTLPKQGMSGAIHNKNQSNSLFINPSLIAWRGNVCKVSFCLEWSANFTNMLNVVRAQNLCVLLQRTLWFLIQKMEFLFCCAVLWWIRASWRYLHIWPDRSSRISSTFSAW